MFRGDISCCAVLVMGIHVFLITLSVVLYAARPSCFRKDKSSAWEGSGRLGKVLWLPNAQVLCPDVLNVPGVCIWGVCE